MLTHNLSGDRFGWLTVIDRAPKKPNTASTYWRCVCDCGATTEVESVRLRNGRTASCGCKKRERLAKSNTIHGAYARGLTSPTARSWHSMIARCTYPSDGSYKYYGAVGVSVCERWRKFENFLADMGERPKGTTIDRINGNRSYEPGNCRWATPSQQSQNIKTNRFVFAEGRKLTIREAAIEYELAYASFRTHLYTHGWFTLPDATIITLLPAASFDL